MSKQRLFSWFDSYDIYNEQGEKAFTVEGKISWGHKLHILNKFGEHIATVKQVVLTFLPRFEFYENGKYIGSIQKKISLLKPDMRSSCLIGSVLYEINRHEFERRKFYEHNRNLSTQKKNKISYIRNRALGD